MALTGAFDIVKGDEHVLASFREAASDLVAQPSVADISKQTDHERSVQVIMDSTGASAENILGGRRGGTGVELARQNQLKSEETAKKRNSDAQLYALLSDLEGALAEVRAEREGYQSELIERYGEDYVEDFGAMYLDPEIMERLDGESDADYNARIKDELKELMLNEDGTIKPGFEDNLMAKLLAAEAREEALKAVIDAVRPYQELQMRGELTPEKLEEFKELIKDLSKAELRVIDDLSDGEIKDLVKIATVEIDKETKYVDTSSPDIAALKNSLMPS